MPEEMLYFECRSGISGDMAVAAMLDLGADADVLDRVLSTLPLEGFRTEVSRVSKSGLDACDFNVILDEDNHDHDDAYLYGSGEHRHEHVHHHSHRGIREITDIIGSAEMTDGARTTALRIFDILAKAESKAHGVPVEEVHFHEVGAVDSIVDIVSLAVCLDNLGIGKVCFSDLCDGQGTVRCQHGIIPVPVPAVVNIVADSGLRLRTLDFQGELVTPTGAAFAAATGNSEVPESFRISRVGIGAGKRKNEMPGIVRAMVITPGSDEGHAFKLECNVDDCSGEALGYAMDRLFAAGARDVFYSPVYMKKNRPAYMLTVICLEEDVPAMEDVIFRETTTIGIRRCPMERTVMDRSSGEADTSLGKVRVKVCRYGGMVKTYPEYESLARLCRERNIPYREAYDTVMSDLGKR